MLETILHSQILYSAVMFVIVLSVLVFVHELGHYLAAKSVGVKVRSFSIGFGKELFGFTLKNKERWKVSLIPLGGYVDLYGMDQDEEDIKKEKDQEVLKSAFFKKNVFARIWVVFAGPFANFLFAIIALTCIFSIYGIKEPGTVVNSVVDGMPAKAAGVLAGDKVLKVDGKAVSTWPELVEIIENTQADKDINLTVLRNNENINIVLKSEVREMENILQEKISKRMIGITLSPEYTLSKQVSVGQAFKESFVKTYEITELILTSVKRMVTGQMKADVGGPLTIAEQSGKAAEGGIYALIMFMVLISINLGILNLLPIPVLDGGHILYCLIEILTFGKGLHEKIKYIANVMGLAILGSLMVFAFYKDIVRIFID